MVHTDHLPASIIRFSMVYGPGDWRDMLKLVRLYKKGLYPKVGNRPKLTPLIHVRDAVAGLILAYEKARIGQVYFLTNESPEKFDDIRQYIARGLGMKRPVLYVPEWMALAGASLIETVCRFAGKVPPVTRNNIRSTLADRVFSMEKSVSDLGFATRIPADQGIIDTVKWYRQQGGYRKMGKEREVFGVTYDRYVLIQLHRELTRQLNLSRIVEMPSHGAKAAGSLYSIGFAMAGCNVTLVNPEVTMLAKWDDIGQTDRMTYREKIDPCRTPFETDAFDLAWNFVTWTELEKPDRYLQEMKRISRKYILLVTCNNFQPGYPWHRFLHYWYGFHWNHGQIKYNHITTVRKLFKQSGITVTESGAVDTPGWPDPSGPRDVRLHRRYGSRDPRLRSIPDWEVPIIEYVKSNTYPGWMKKLGKWDMLFRKGVFKLPLSHLFYVLGEKSDD